jgi:hypothetical protein
MAVRSSEKRPGRIKILAGNNIFHTNIRAAIPAEE